MMQVTDLPSELLLMICSNLSIQDLSSLSETCVKMYSHATDPILWEHAFQQVPSYLINEDPKHFLQLLNLKRFQRIRKIFLELTPSLDKKHTSELFDSLKRKTFLQEVIFGDCSLVCVPTDLLTSFLDQIPSVTFDFGTDVTEDQMQSLFKSIRNGNEVKRLYLEELNLRSIDAKTFARAVNSLNEFNSYYIEYTNEQVREMFDEMAEDTKLEKLVFHYRRVDFIDSIVLAKAFNNLTDLTVNLSDLPFTNDQIYQIFKQMSQNTKLEKLEILTFSYPDMWDFSFISPTVLADALKNLKEIYLADIVFSNPQICKIFEMLSTNEDKVVLDLGCCNLSDVPIELLEATSENLVLNSFARKLKYRIIQLYSESVQHLRSRLKATNDEHKKVVEEILVLRNENKQMNRAAIKAKGFILIPHPGVSKFYQKSIYSSRSSYLKYSRNLKKAVVCRTLKLRSHVEDCRKIRNMFVN